MTPYKEAADALCELWASMSTFAVDKYGGERNIPRSMESTLMGVIIAIGCLSLGKKVDDADVHTCHEWGLAYLNAWVESLPKEK